MGIKVSNISKVFNSSTCGLVALLALASGPVFSQLTGDGGPQQNTAIAKTTPPAADKNGKMVIIKSEKGRAKSSVKSGVKTSAKPRNPASIPPRGTNTVSPKPETPVTPNHVPIITYISQDAKEWIRAGEMVHITLQGTPGGRAMFRVIGLTESIAMQESAPGRYIGTWTVPDGKPLPMTRALVAGDLSLNGKSAVTMQASRPLCLDTVAPLIQNLTPAPQSSVMTATPSLSADLSDTGSGIDIGAMRLIINGRDLSGEANIASDHITYKPVNPLSSGDQTIQLIVVDRAGNTTTQTWHFTINAKTTTNE